MIDAQFLYEHNSGVAGETWTASEAELLARKIEAAFERLVRNRQHTLSVYARDITRIEIDATSLQYRSLDELANHLAGELYRFVQGGPGDGGD